MADMHNLTNTCMSLPWITVYNPIRVQVLLDKHRQMEGVPNGIIPNIIPFTLLIIVTTSYKTIITMALFLLYACSIGIDIIWLLPEVSATSLTLPLKNKVKPNLSEYVM